MYMSIGEHTEHYACPVGHRRRHCRLRDKLRDVNRFHSARTDRNRLIPPLPLCHQLEPNADGAPATGPRDTAVKIKHKAPTIDGLIEDHNDVCNVRNGRDTRQLNDGI